MKKTLKDFTPEIKAKIPLYKEKVLKGLCSGEEYKTNKLEDSVKYIHKIYELAGEKKPLVFFANNPDEYKILFEIIPIILNSSSASLYASLDASLDASLGGSLDDSLYASLCASLGDSLDDSLYASLDASLDASLGGSLDDSLRASLRASLDTSLGGSLGDSLDDSLDASLDASLRVSLDVSLSDSLRDNKSRSSWLYLCSIYSRVYLTWYKFIQDEFNIDHDKKDILNELYELINKSFISRCWFTKAFVLVLKTPTEIHFNDDNVLHNVNGASYQYNGKCKKYHVNGREVEAELIEGSFTKEDLINEDNEDIKAAMITIIKERNGDKGLLDFLGAEVVDEQIIQHNKNYSETLRLYKTKEKYDILQDRHGNSNQPYCWSEMVCPSTGSTYLIENSADFTDAVEAAKFLRPVFVPNEIDYKWAEFAN